MLPKAMVAALIDKKQTTYLVIGAGQILGGATCIPDGDGSINLDAMGSSVLHSAWTVTDMVSPWPQLVAQGQVRLVPVSAMMDEAVRASLDRFSADGQRRIQSEADKRQGALEAIQNMTLTAFTAGAAAAAKLPSPGG